MSTIEDKMLIIARTGKIPEITLGLDEKGWRPLVWVTGNEAEWWGDTVEEALDLAIQGLALGEDEK